MKIAIIGAGISGLSCAHFLKENNNITLFEKESTPGGLIRCKRVNNCLFHICGGHVFNSKRKDVLDWFWSQFDKSEWLKADRNAIVFMDKEKKIPYPIENHMYLFDEQIQKSFIKDLIKIACEKNVILSNFEDFLKHRFGETLYEIYFKPYNEKIWRRNLSQVPLSWLEGKLPMPTIEEMIFNNINHVKEKKFVHSSFWYEKKNGSQFIADTLAKGLDIRYDSEIVDIVKTQNGWNILGEDFDIVIFCGNIKNLPRILKNVDLSQFERNINELEFHGTTSAFCEIDKNPYSWIYQPSKEHESHRIICTGNFAASNNSGNILTGTIEFTDEISIESIKSNLKKMPLNPKYIDHCYNKYTYPIQNLITREMIRNLKSHLLASKFYLTGRFADWEYYNMDAAIGAAMDLCKQIR